MWWARLLNSIAGILSPLGAAPIVGDFESIATVTPSGVNTITFSSIPSTYKHLQIRFIARDVSNTTQPSMFLRFNGDTASNYSRHQMSADGSTMAAYGQGSVTWGVLTAMTGSTGLYGSNVFGVGIVDVLDYADTNKYKTTRALSGQDTNNTYGVIYYASGVWQSTSAINSITLYTSTGSNYASGTHIALYGIAG